jgi:hypothetical protein
MSKSEIRTGPSGQYLLMSLRTTGHYACGTDQSGKRIWAPIDDPDLQTFPSEEALNTVPEEDAIFVEVLNRSPEFPKKSGLGRNDALMEKDYHIWAPRCGELFFFPTSKSTKSAIRLIGLHVDARDFYFRMQHPFGDTFFLSMAIALSPLRENVSIQDYKEAEAEFLATGALAPKEFLVTREIEKPWPRPASPAHYMHVFGYNDHLCFGPFTDPEHLDAFKQKASDAEGFGITGIWTDAIRERPDFHGTCLPADFHDRKAENFEGEDDMETIDNLFMAISKAAIKSEEDTPGWHSFS